MFSTVLLVMKDENLRDFFSRVLGNSGLEILDVGDEKQLQKLNDSEAKALRCIIIDEPLDAKGCMESLVVRWETFGLRPPPVIAMIRKNAANEALCRELFTTCVMKVNFDIAGLVNQVELFSCGKLDSQSRGPNSTVVILPPLNK
jgi:DNA-binding response OmpR family regulator